MNINQPSIWASIEMDCVSRDFSYEQYLEAHANVSCKGAPVDHRMYSELSDVLYGSMERDFSRSVK